ncbi:MAG TPA: YraN family protein [Spirochaetia bacterium]|nr:YraN family protein [Spirochaetia bacterium]
MPKHSESTFQRGRRGEETACRYLAANGYRILVRNFRAPRGEIDIIAENEGTIAFVEVKSRRSSDRAVFEQSVGLRKQRRIINASRLYLAGMGADERFHVRFDVVFVLGDSTEVYHVPGAFTERT